MLELQINKDLEQLDVDSNIEPESKHDIELMPETTQRVETKTAPKSRGRPKGLKNKVYTPNPKLNKETQQATQQLKLKLSSNSKSNTAFYTAYAASLALLIYNDLETIKETKLRPNWLEWKKAIKKEY